MIRRLMLFSLLSCMVSAGLPQFAFAAKTSATGTSSSKPAASRHKVVFQVSDSDPAKWVLALNNARNVQQDLGDRNVDIEIVAYGPGIDMLKMESQAGSLIGDAIATGVIVVACENTMHTQKLSRADMLSGIGYVKAGVVELMKRQRQGWAYIRP